MLFFWLGLIRFSISVQSSSTTSFWGISVLPDQMLSLHSVQCFVLCMLTISVAFTTMFKY